MVICLEQGADLRMAQRMPLPLTVSCFSKIQTGFTFLVPAYPGSPGKRAVKRVCVCVYYYLRQKSEISSHEHLRSEVETSSLTKVVFWLCYLIGYSNQPVAFSHKHLVFSLSF